MNISILINGKSESFEVNSRTYLLELLRSAGYFGAKFGGCSKGECGACTVLLDGRPINSCQVLAIELNGHSIETIESQGENPEKGWSKNLGFSIIQQAFLESGAVQCGYCTPAMILAVKALLGKNPDPTDAEIRDSLSGILCRCTGYLKPVEAVRMVVDRLKHKNTFNQTDELNNQINEATNFEDLPDSNFSPSNSNIDTITLTKPLVIKQTPIKQEHDWVTVGKPEEKVDGAKLVQGKPAFTSDFEIRGLLHAKVLRSPFAHALIKKIDVTKAKALPGVAAVLTWEDIPRVVYSTAGQSDPIPGPLDSFSLDKKVRHVGDKVAFVAAETVEIATKALELIDVEYESLDTILDPAEAMKQGAVVIHDEPEYVNFADSNPKINLASEIRIDIGDVDKGFEEADFIFEEDYAVPKVQQAHIEPHAAITYWDEDDRLVIRTSTQVPFHVRRMLAPVLNLPVKKIRVIKPRIGGGFGGKQEVLMEDVPAHLTIATGRPVSYVYTREEEFTAARSRHPMTIHMKTGVKKDGTITANEMYALSDTGAYGCHALTVTGNTGHKAMAIYVGDGKYRKNPNIRFYADIVYTNTPPAGAFRGYGVPQGTWAVERHMELIAGKLNIDPIEFRLKNAIRPGELHPFSTAWSEGREPKPEIIHTVGIEECVTQAKAVMGWDQKYGNIQWKAIPGKPHLRKGIGMSLAMHGTAIPYLDMGGASIKLNDDGSFNLLIGATDLGTGSDTILAQMAAEVLGTSIKEIIVYSSDTDFTPFDKGAYASSTTYISGGAVTRAAQKAAEMIKRRAAMMLAAEDNASVESYQLSDIKLRDSAANYIDGRVISLQDIALHSLHQQDQEQIMAVDSFVSKSSPPPFAAQFSEITLDIETGNLIVDKLVMAVDAGIIVNPATASGQIEGGMTQALGYAVCEEMTYQSDGTPVETDLISYHIFRSDEMPELKVLFVETFEPTHPFGVKALAEIPMDAVAPAVGNAILNASGAHVNQIPATPKRIWEAMQKR